MRFTIYLEVFLAVICAIFIVLQFIVPAVRGTKLLPLFRKERELKADILSEQQADYERDLETRREEQAHRADFETGADAPIGSPEWDTYWAAQKRRRDDEKGSRK